MKFGKAFSDNVLYERERRGLFSTAVPSWWLGAGRPLFFITILFLAFFILLWRLFNLTMVNGHTYRLLSDNNRTKQLTIHAPRGQLLDRTGKPLAYNVPYVRVLKPCETNPEKLCGSSLSKEEGDALKAKNTQTSWFLESDFQRAYALPEALFHVIGYVGEVNEKELSDEYYQLRGYKLGDEMGRSGAEAVFEEELRGKDGKEFVEVDAKGSIIRVLGQTPSVDGSSIELSLDKGLSEAAFRAFPKDQKGAIIVSKPSTGEILALYSSPTFSSDLLTRGINPDQYASLMTNPDRPLFNRGIGGVYPPGSIFKLITSTAGLEEGVITKGKTVEDIGEIAIGPYKFPTWNFKKTGKTDGLVDVTKALQKSNDIFFYKVGEWLGITKLGAWARKMGVGTLLGIELPGEAQGLMPDPSWKNSMFQTKEDIDARNNEWYLGDTYHASIGQGYVLTSPLQGNTWTNVIANGGKLCRPTIKKLSAVSSQSSDCKDLGIKKETIDLIVEGMREACSSGGTGYPLFDFGIRKKTLDDGTVIATTSGTLTKIPVACKTGTAEYGDPNQKTHAWFTVFAPLPDGALAKSGVLGESTITGEPEISVTVLIEGAGEGSDKAAPVAKQILEEWFSR
jgi:penicillin-binding protein 2